MIKVIKNVKTKLAKVQLNKRFSFLLFSLGSSKIEGEVDVTIENENTSNKDEEANELNNRPFIETLTKATESNEKEDENT